MTTATAPSARPGIGRGRSLEDCENRLELAAQILHRLRGECAPCLGLELTRAAVLLDLLTRAHAPAPARAPSRRPPPAASACRRTAPRPPARRSGAPPRAARRA